MSEEYFLSLSSFYGYRGSQIELLAGEYIIYRSHEWNHLFTINEDNRRIGTRFTADDIRDFLFPYTGNMIVESFDGYRSLFMPEAETSAIRIQRAVRTYLKKLKWHRTGIAIMTLLSPILYHPKSPYIQRRIASW